MVVNNKQCASITWLPRLIRLRDAPHYLGMNKNYFNRVVRGEMPEIRIGDRGIAFDRVDLDAWVVQNKQCSKASVVILNRKKTLCQRNTQQGSLKEKKYGTLKNKSSVADFEKVLAKVMSRKRRNI